MPSLAVIKKEFPVFTEYSDLVYLDNASTTQKPARVLAAERDFYVRSNANIHRGVYGLAERADAVYEGARRVVADFVGVAPDNIIFTKNVTEAANLLAFGSGESLVKAGDNIVVTELEHHANYLPWQEMARRKKLELRVVPIDPASGKLDMKVMEKMIDRKTRIVAVTQMSNVLGVRPDIAAIVEMAHQKGALVVMDAAQSVAHLPTDFAKLGVDAAFFSGHKIYGPMGTGMLYMTDDLAKRIPPLLTGGGMIANLPDQWLESPAKFEAGTPNVAGLAGLAAAIKFIKAIGLDKIAAQEVKLAGQCREILSHIAEVKLFGDNHDFPSIVAFDVKGVHPHDLASVLAEDNVCIRAGHHCAKPLLKRLGKKALARVSLGIYNNADDLQRLEKGILRAIKKFK